MNSGDYMKTFGQRLARLRKSHNLTQQELAKRLRVSKSSLGMYEIGQREPNFETLVRMGDFFGVSMDYLIKGNEKQITEDPIV